MGASAVGYTPVKGYVESSDGSEEWLKNALIKGPVTVGIHIVNSLFAYKTGIYYDADCTPKNPSYQGGHAVIAVGFGTDPSEGDYWIVRNSWGPDWGIKGYILMARNRGNLCSIASWATYPLI